MTMGGDDEPITLPEYRDNPFINRLPPILSAAEALERLTDLPAFDEAERRYPAHLRAHCVQRLGRYFDPLDRHILLESRFSMLVRQGYLGRNPANGDYVRRLQNSYDRLEQNDLGIAPRHSVEATANGFAIVGCSGIGKSRGIERVLKLYPQTIHHSQPFSLEQVVWLKLDCPYKGSPKQLCINFFAEMDLLLGTRYRRKYGASRFAVDEMMAWMAHVAELHALGTLVVDEIQHLRQAPGASRDDLLNFLVTLVNTIGIPVMIIGTLAAVPLLQGAFRNARRASGMGSLTWERLPQGPAWNQFVERMWDFQWTREHTPLTEELRHVLYDETQGIVDLVVKLFMLTQVHAIQLGALRDRPERLGAGLLRHVAKENFKLVAPMIEALRANDMKALVLYDDLSPLHAFVQQALDDATTQLAPSVTVGPRVSGRKPGRDEGKAREATLNALQAIGLTQELAELALSDALAEAPDLGPMDLLARIMDKLQGREPEKKPVKRRGVSKAKGVPLAPLEANDLRAIAAQAKAGGQTVHAAFLDAGVIKPPMADFAA
ncbi:ATP-binding protein [Azospirillum sp. sgz302134]